MNADSATTTSPAPRECYPHHRDCIKCGYDLIGQALDGQCPECNALVAATAQRPLWTATHARPLARSRWAFRLAAFAFVSLVALVGASTAASAFIAPSHPSFVASNVGIAAALLTAFVTMLASLVVMGFGAGSPAWRRWAPLGFSLASVLWALLGGESFFPRRLYMGGPAVGVTFFWAAGVSMQNAAVAVTVGLPLRSAGVRARRVLAVTRLLLLIPVVVAWGFVALMAFRRQMDSWTYLNAMIPVLYCILGSILLWMLVAAGHWLRLLRFMGTRPPRTLPP